MNDKCKYCDYVSKCSRICEYNSYLCKVHRSFPKVVDKSYEQLQQENKILKENAEHNDKVVDNVNWENMLLKKENQQLKSDINKLQKELNEENLQCSKYSIEFNNLKRKNEQLKDNWNKLKDYIVKEYYMYLPLEASTRSITILIDKMQELEQGSDSNENN